MQYITAHAHTLTHIYYIYIQNKITVFQNIPQTWKTRAPTVTKRFYSANKTIFIRGGKTYKNTPRMCIACS